MSRIAEKAHIVHGTGLVVGQWGLLIRGPSGMGKSLLALELIESAEQASAHSRLVADDRVELRQEAGTLIMAPPAAIAGLIELRGRGVVSRDFVRSARLHLIVDLVDELMRMPEPAEFTVELEGIRLARCPVPRRDVVDGGHQRLLVAEALRALEAEKTGVRKKTA
jgi:serine kinase of HPr protein (carbohydrate metabolism regulator)